MRKLLLRFFDFLFLQKQLSLVLLFIWGIILFLPEPFKIQAPSSRGFIISCGFNLLLCFSFSWLICVSGEFFCRIGIKILYYLWISIWSIFLVFYSISEIFLITYFNLQWNAFTFQLLSETNNEESIGFFETYGGTWTFNTLVLLGGITLGFCAWSIFHFNMRNMENTKQGCLKRKIFISIILLLLCVEGRCFTIDFYTNFSNSDKLIRRSGLWNLYQSILQFNSGKEQLETCAQAQKDLRINDVNFTSDNIVLIIGETFNRHHSDLYGYPLQTNPLLRNLNPIVFSDVIAPYNATTLSFRCFLSFEEMDESEHWYETPLFPAIFKSSGYNVIFYSNQYVVEGNLDFYDASAGFFNHPAIYTKLFDVRNHKKHSFDMQMVNEYKTERDKLEREHKNLIIFHLEGQHSPAVERYPAEYTQFTPSDYNRSELSTAQKQYIADYDNATLYNDSVVSEIISMYVDKDAIVLYFADHGEEIYDFRDKAGRFSDFEKTGADGLKNQLDIPFMVFVTDKYRQEHPELVSSIESAKNKPFMIDLLPHLLLWLGGIDSEWYVDSKNLFSENYNCSRERIVSNGLNYDLICNKNQ